jgi:hypothetical protein
VGKSRIAFVAIVFALLRAAGCDTTYSAVGADGDASTSSGVDASTDASRSSDGASTNDVANGQPDAGTDATTKDASSGDSGACSNDLMSDAMNCGSCGHICNTAGGCMLGECEHIVFVAIGANGPNLGGLLGADDLCQKTAQNAGLHGSFFAWLGTAASSPATRFFKATRPYKLPGGDVVSPSWTELTGGSLLHAISQSANGGATTSQVWTSVADDGTYAPLDGNACANWTSTNQADRSAWGNAGGMGGGWTNSSSDSCDTPGHGIYCFEQ